MPKYQRSYHEPLLGAVFAELVDHRRAADDGFEAVGLAFDEAGHLAAVAVAHQRQLRRVDRVVREHVVDAGHHVLIVAAAEVVLVGRGKFDAVVRGAARIGAQHRPAVADEEVDEGIVAVFPCTERAAVDIDDERNFCGAGVGREIEQAFDGEWA